MLYAFLPACATACLPALPACVTASLPAQVIAPPPPRWHQQCGGGYRATGEGQHVTGTDDEALSFHAVLNKP